jgi:hypothetical protein
MQPAKLFDGKKFMWDGREYADRPAAESTAQSYRKDGFEAHMLEEGGTWFVFSRRPVKESAAGAQSA